MMATVVLGPLIGALTLSTGLASIISEARRDEHGFLVHTVPSPFQANPTAIKVLLPTQPKDTRFPVVYLLPVEARDGHRYGDGLLEAKKQDLHERFGAIFVEPEFSHLPWYADHSSDPEIRQESYFLKVVVPLIEESYAVRTDRDGRLLLGFSKSGWGAYSLLLRHPDRFGKAAAWDAPLMEQRPERFGMGAIFGTQENFEQYRITTLLERCAPQLRDESRLILLGYGNFRAQHEQAHALMTKLGVAHVYRDGPKREHHWESGWLGEAVELLLGNGAVIR
jgi:predicted alpha/beta superfamily hydrolase